MREEDLRRVLLVKAVEESDADATLIPAADRAAAAREAMREAGAGDEERLLAARSKTLLARIEARFPFVAEVLALLGATPALTWAVVALGLLLGGAMSVLDGSRRINVLAFPLLGIVAWNLAVYALLLHHGLRRGRPAAAPLRAWLASAGSSFATRLITRSQAFNAPLAGALRTFSAEWFAATRPLLLARAARAFHLGAAAVGIGLIAGLYLRGIAFDYRAGWESTFLDASQARHALALLYGPASWVTGIAVPDAAQLEATRWRADGGGEPAARWIHLMAATAFLYVVLPRLVLALAASASAMRLALRAPVPAALTSYFRTAFAAVEGAVRKTLVVVMPYAYELPADSLIKLIAWVPQALGGPVEIQARESVPYGEEDRYLATLGERGADGADVLLMPFSLAATPEDENHGSVLAGVRDKLAASGRTRLMVVVDEAPFAERMAAAPQRVDERRESWRQFLAARGLEATFVRLAP